MTHIEWLRNEVKENIEYMEKEGNPAAARTLRDVLDYMTPKETEIEGGGTTWWIVCPECHGAIDRQDHFCKHCGQAVKE